MPKILLVDDSETVIMLQKLMFRSEGYIIVTAKNGLEAIEKAKSDPPDVIILDINMPELDGIETCRRLKNDPNTNPIPIIMVTTHGETERVEQSYLAGCNDYCTKPIDKVELLKKIKAQIGR